MFTHYKKQLLKLVKNMRFAQSKLQMQQVVTHKGGQIWGWEKCN